MKLYGVDYIGSGGIHPKNRVLLQTATASATASITFTLSPEYLVYILEFYKVRPVTDDQTLFIRCSNDGGATFDSGNNYHWSALIQGSGFVAIADGVQDADKIILGGDAATTGMSDLETEAGGAGELWMFAPLDKTVKTNMMYTIVFGANSGTGGSTQAKGAGAFGSSAGSPNASRVDAFSLQMESGNIATGIFNLWALEL